LEYYLQMQALVRFGPKLIQPLSFRQQKRKVHSPINYVSKLNPYPGPQEKSIPAYRVLDQDGHVIDPKEVPKVHANSDDILKIQSLADTR
jgi:hypothetical protein